MQGDVTILLKEYRPVYCYSIYDILISTSNFQTTKHTRFKVSISTGMWSIYNTAGYICFYKVYVYFYLLYKS
jgi:hypothetical protein